MTIADLDIGHRATIKAIAQGSFTMRLNEMGLVAGEEVTMLKKALWGDPVEIKVLNYNLCLRKSEAAAIEVDLSSAKVK